MLLLSVILSAGIAQAQHSYYLGIDNNVTAIDNVVVKDSITPANNLVCTASFDIMLKTDELSTQILTALKSAIDKNITSTILISITNTNGELLEERTYAAASITKLDLSPFDGASRSASWMRVTIESPLLSLKPGNGGKFALKQQPKSQAVLASNYSFKLGQLPSARIAKISSLGFGNNNGALNFTVDMVEQDAKEWHDWLMSATRQGTKKDEGILTLLAANFRDKVFEFTLKEVQVVSYSFGGTATQSISRVSIGLRAKSITIVPLK